MIYQVAVLDILSHASDILTITSIVVAYIVTLKYKNINVIASNISLVFVYIVRGTILYIFAYIMFFMLYKEVFLLAISAFGEPNASESLWWDSGQVYAYIISHFISLNLYLIIIYIIGAFIITLSWNRSKLFINKLIGTKLKLKKYPQLIILSAVYGSEISTIDLTNILKSWVRDDKLTIKAGNHIGGDPHFRTPKKLKVDYIYGDYDSEPESITVNEDEILRLPIEKKTVLADAMP